MATITYNKLVRDNIPEIIEEGGAKAETRILETDEYHQELKKKLLEEAQEVTKTSDKQEIKKELSDVMEVIDTIVEAYELSPDEINKLQLERREKRGGFKKRIFLISTSGDDYTG